MKYKVNFELDLKHNPYNSIYIALEGIDGSGKTTQVEEIAKYFESKGRKVVRTREPRKEGLIGDIIHDVLLGKAKIPPKALQYLFTTDRMIHHEEVIVPALKNGNIVISDRCFWSAIVYGILDKEEEGYSEKDADQILVAQSILSFYHQFIVPDYTFYLKIDLEESLKRIKEKLKTNKKEIYEEEGKLKKVIEGYDWLSKKFKEEIIEIDGSHSMGVVTEEIVRIVNSK